MGQELTYLVGILVSIPMLLLVPMLLWTPAWTFFKGRRENKPVRFDVENGKYRVANKIEAGMEVYNIGGEKVMMPLDRKTTEKTPYGEFGLMFPSHCTGINPKALPISLELKKKGYKRITEVQIALALIHLEKEYPDIDPTDSTKFYKVSDSFGNVQTVSGMEFFMGEMEERGIYPFAITAKEIKRLISDGKYAEAEGLDEPLRNMIDYVGLETRPASLSNWVNEMVNQAKTESLLGNLKKNAVNIALVMGILMVAVIGFYLIQKGGGIDALMGTKKVIVQTASTTVTTLVNM